MGCESAVNYKNEGRKGPGGKKGTKQVVSLWETPFVKRNGMFFENRKHSCTGELDEKKKGGGSIAERKLAKRPRL